MITNNCPNCGASIRIEQGAHRKDCEFCGFTMLLQQTQQSQQTVHIVQSVNHEFESKLMLAENMAEIYLKSGPKSVKTSNGKSGFNAVLDYYADAEHAGGHEPRYWLSISRFYAKTMLQEVPAGRLKLLCLEKLVIDYKFLFNNALKQTPGDQSALIKERDDTEANLKNTLGSIPQKKPGGNMAIKEVGCYVATSVYGSYDCPEVWTLRRYRDFKLSNTRRGRFFIKFYYKTSPALIKMFGKTRLFQRIAKRFLDRKTAKLQKQGFESTPYKDFI